MNGNGDRPDGATEATSSDPSTGTDCTSTPTPGRYPFVDEIDRLLTECAAKSQARIATRDPSLEPAGKGDHNANGDPVLVVNGAVAESASEAPKVVAKPTKDVGDDGPADEPSMASTTDAGNDAQQRLDDAFIGAYLADHYLGDFVYAPGLGWLKFDGRRWASSSAEVVGEAIRLAVIDFHTIEAKTGRGHQRLKQIDGLLTAGKLRAMQGIARNRLCRMAHEFDTHPDLLNVRNGVVDLRYGTLSPHDRKLMLTKVTMVDFRPGAEHADWKQALNALPSGAPPWLQLRLGQAITGHPTPDDKLVVAKGSGANGKTTLLDAVRRAVGDDYAVMMPERVLLARTGEHPTELMTLRGARLALMEELPELGYLNAKRLKDLHGTGQMSARYCGQDTVHWSPTHSAVVTTNYLPRMDESDHGTWRRVALLDFPYRFVSSAGKVRNALDRVGDPNLRERLRRGRNGQPEAVLAWLIAGAVQWYQRDRVLPSEPECVHEATQKWRETSDLLMRYIYERLVFDVYQYVASVDLYHDFSEWLASNGHRSWSDQLFTTRFINHSEVTDHDLQKKVVRQTRAGTLSRPAGEGLGTGKSLGKQFTAYLGVGFRTKAGFEESNDDQD